jgi:hypothetical protein
MPSVRSRTDCDRLDEYWRKTIRALKPGAGESSRRNGDGPEKMEASTL